MKILFAGTPEFAVLPLNSIHAAGYEIAAVLTQPDKPQGRKGILTPSPVKREAMRLVIPVLQPVRLREEVALLRAAGADCMVTCAYGQILTQEVLDVFPLGVWNIHASLLPAYRGAAPIPRVILDGCEETGVTIMKTELGLDTGDMLLKRSIRIENTDTCGTLSEKLSSLSGPLILEALEQIATGNPRLEKQGEGFTCKKVQRTQVDFSRSAREVCNLIRGLSPAPLSFATVGGITLNLHFAEEISGEFDAPFGTVLHASAKTGLVVKCGEGAVRLTRLQPAGGKLMTDRDFCNGRKLTEGMCFDKPVL